MIDIFETDNWILTKAGGIRNEIMHFENIELLKTNFKSTFRPHFLTDFGFFIEQFSIKL